MVGESTPFDSLQVAFWRIVCKGANNDHFLGSGIAERSFGELLENKDK